MDAVERVKHIGIEALHPNSNPRETNSSKIRQKFHSRYQNADYIKLKTIAVASNSCTQVSNIAGDQRQFMFLSFKSCIDGTNKLMENFNLVCM